MILGAVTVVGAIRRAAHVQNRKIDWAPPRPGRMRVRAPHASSNNRGSDIGLPTSILYDITVVERSNGV